MKFGSLFSGIGGIDLGLEWAGMECAWQVEIDDWCQSKLQKHWPDVPKHKDVREVGANNLGTVDLIAGGFPCQPFSLAGNRKGKEDDRYLWPEMLRVISELQPTWVLGENVTGIIDMALDQVLSDLESRDYSCQPFVVPACAINAPHRRDRVWIVAHSNSIGLQRRQEQRSSGEEGKKAHQQLQRLLPPDPWSNIPRPGINRVDYGIPNRVERIKALGNAVVPQVVAEIGRAIITSHNRDYEVKED